MPHARETSYQCFETLLFRLGEPYQYRRRCQWLWRLKRRRRRVDQTPRLAYSKWKWCTYFSRSLPGNHDVNTCLPPARSSIPISRPTWTLIVTVKRRRLIESKPRRFGETPKYFARSPLRSFYRNTPILSPEDTATIIEVILTPHRSLARTNEKHITRLDSTASIDPGTPIATTTNAEGVTASQAERLIDDRKA
jgi:hypothetical protein